MNKFVRLILATLIYFVVIVIGIAIDCFILADEMPIALYYTLGWTACAIFCMVTDINVKK